jgi:hypothetical protein
MRASRPITSTQTAALVTRLRDQTIPRLTADLARRQLAGLQARQGSPSKTLVDGRANAPLDSVRPFGEIRFIFLDLGPALDWIWQELVTHSPIGPERGQPHYFQVHWLIVDGIWVDVPEAAETMQIRANAVAQFVNARPYSRALERGLSTQAPDGVYEITAMAAQERFPDAAVTFSYVGEGDVPVPIPWPVKASYAFPSITVKVANA